MTAAAPTETARQRRHRQTSREILAAAWDLCREHGLAGLSLRELASRVGLRAPSLYSYFDSKHAIYDAMFREGNEQLAVTMAAVSPDGPITRNDVKRGIHAFFEFCTEDPVRYQLLFQRTIPGFYPSPESYALAVENLAAAKRYLAQLGIADPTAHDIFTALIAGLVAQQIANEPEGDRWRRLADRAVDIYLDAFGVPTP